MLDIERPVISIEIKSVGIAVNTLRNNNIFSYSTVYHQVASWSDFIAELIICLNHCILITINIKMVSIE